MCVFIRVVFTAVDWVIPEGVQNWDRVDSRQDRSICLQFQLIPYLRLLRPARNIDRTPHNTCLRKGRKS